MRLWENSVMRKENGQYSREATVSHVETKSIKLRGSTVTDTTPIFTYTVNGKEYTYKAEMSTTNRKRFIVGKKEFIYINVPMEI